MGGCRPPGLGAAELHAGHQLGTGAWEPDIACSQGALWWQCAESAGSGHNQWSHPPTPPHTHTHSVLESSSAGNKNRTLTPHSTGSAQQEPPNASGPAAQDLQHSHILARVAFIPALSCHLGPAAGRSLSKQPGLSPGMGDRNSPQAQGHSPGGRGRERPMELRTPTGPRRGRSWDMCPPALVGVKWGCHGGGVG